MAAKKTVSKASRKTVATRGAKPKGKKAAAKAATKPAARPAAKKKAAKKPAAASGAKKATARKPRPEQAAAEKTTAKKAAAKPAAPSPAPEARAPQPKGAISSKQVNLGHVLALRPRVSASFKPDSLREARQQLEDEGYATLEEAARAVAEKALSLTRDGGKSRRNRGRR